MTRTDSRLSPDGGASGASKISAVPIRVSSQGLKNSELHGGDFRFVEGGGGSGTHHQMSKTADTK